MSGEHVERIARALCVKSGDDPDALTYAHEHLCTGRDRSPKHRWMYWIPFAEIAIAEMASAQEVGRKPHHQAKAALVLGLTPPQKRLAE